VAVGEHLVDLSGCISGAGWWLELLDLGSWQPRLNRLLMCQDVTDASVGQGLPPEASARTIRCASVAQNSFTALSGDAATARSAAVPGEGIQPAAAAGSRAEPLGPSAVCASGTDATRCAAESRATSAGDSAGWAGAAAAAECAAGSCAVSAGPFAGCAAAAGAAATKQRALRAATAVSRPATSRLRYTSNMTQSHTGGQVTHTAQSLLARAPVGGNVAGATPAPPPCSCRHSSQGFRVFTSTTCRVIHSCSCCRCSSGSAASAAASDDENHDRMSTCARRSSCHCK